MARNLLLQGCFREALFCAQQNLLDAPDSSALWEVVGLCASHFQDEALAELAWTKVTESQPSVEALNNLGILLDTQGRFTEAARAYHQALTLAPQDPAVLGNYGLLLEHQLRWGEAETIQREALRLDPGSAKILSNLAGVLALQGKDGEAESFYAEAIRCQPDFVVAHVNLGILLTDQDRFEEAERVLRRALVIEPGNRPARTSLAQLLLCQGRLDEGWEWFASRQTVAAIDNWFAGGEDRRACHPWQGEPLAGKTILVLPEQGFGDEIQFARYLGWLKSQGASRVTQVCRDEQRDLMRTLTGPDMVVGLTEAAGYRDDYDYWTLLMSLPGLARTTLETVPAATPYLAPDACRVVRWATRLPVGKRRVGLVWRGNPHHSNDVERSLPGLETLAPLWQVGGVAFVGLQKPMPDGEAEVAPRNQPLYDLGAEIVDFADTAAILTQLDLVICVDTAVAHLAGALGVPCWVLLAAHKTDWRWLRQRTDSPWYPGMRLFRQRQRGDWTQPVTQVVDALREWLCVPGETTPRR